MVVIVKRYPLNDVPVKVSKTREAARRYVKQQHWKEGDRATHRDQYLAGGSIGLPLISVDGYETDVHGQVIDVVSLLEQGDVRWLRT